MNGAHNGAHIEGQNEEENKNNKIFMNNNIQENNTNSARSNLSKNQQLLDNLTIYFSENHISSFKNTIVKTIEDIKRKIETTNKNIIIFKKKNTKQNIDIELKKEHWIKYYENIVIFEKIKKDYIENIIKSISNCNRYTSLMNTQISNCDADQKYLRDIKALQSNLFKRISTNKYIEKIEEFIKYTEEQERIIEELKHTNDFNITQLQELSQKYNIIDYTEERQKLEKSISLHYKVNISKKNKQMNITTISSLIEYLGTLSTEVSKIKKNAEMPNNSLIQKSLNIIKTETDTYKTVLETLIKSERQKYNTEITQYNENLTRQMKRIKHNLDALDENIKSYGGTKKKLTNSKTNIKKHKVLETLITRINLISSKLIHNDLIKTKISEIRSKVFEHNNKSEQTTNLPENNPRSTAKNNEDIIKQLENNSEALLKGLE